ncbi:MAG: hypothetical protein ACOY0T_21275 [Myxococcota bacterium]
MNEAPFQLPPEDAHAFAPQEPLPPNFRPRAAWPRLGPALWIAGVLLWSYVTLGRLVVRQGFPEGVAFIVMLFCLGVSAYFSLEPFQPASSPFGSGGDLSRFGMPVALALLLFVASIVLAVLIGLTSRDDLGDPLAAVLTLIALTALFVGRRSSLPASVRPKDPVRRALGIFLWIGGIALTVLAWSA